MFCVSQTEAGVTSHVSHLFGSSVFLNAP
ncbi:hypothetical protein SBRY_40102 [Actinacidiphila bryophytorum]|uniref:Uncharacterized protein n=1 Tax=Actinacidiphila bryophytorum TaxID=1436133 RepID=A0A9W4H247_9ACTN|nr:hypothetical protein SBRY_40102 [Actinacidiphila bryophytorum]